MAKRFHPEKILTNPNNACPPEILQQQTALLVEHVGFDQQLHRGIIEINRSVTQEVKDFFLLAQKLSFPIQEVTPASNPRYAWDDNKLMAANATSGFNYRLIAGTNRPSLHGLGLAIDVNPRLNPYMRYQDGEVTIIPSGAARDLEAPGTFYGEHELVQFMLAHGWEWGGFWTPDSGRTDYHHFQKSIAT